MESLQQEPQTGAFVPLDEHQSTTPASFHSGPPILYYYSDRCKVVALENELPNAPILQNLTTKVARPAHSNEQYDSENANGDQAPQITLEEIDVWVTSEKLLLYSKPHAIGLSISYPSIVLHAIQSQPTPSTIEPQSQGIYMQIMPVIPPSHDEEPPETISLTIVPTASAPPPSTAPTANEDDAIESESKPEQTPAQAFFTALSDCSNLHPDLMDDDEEEGSRLMQAGLAIPGNSDGSLPPPMPGSGGWITAENMHEFIDEDGNFIMEDEEENTVETTELGPGAGTVRQHPDDDGKDGSTDDTKWQRTS